MKTTLSLQSAIAIGGCQNGIQRYIDFIEGLGYTVDTEFDFDFFVSLCRENKARFLESFVIENKASILEYTDSQVQCYIANYQEFATLEEAQSAVEQYRQERRQYHKLLTTVGFSQMIDGNSVWSSVDLDTFELPDSDVEQCLYVFNHAAGVHVQANTKEDAIRVRDELIEGMLEQEANTFLIRRKLIFLEDGVSTRIELVE